MILFELKLISEHIIIAIDHDEYRIDLFICFNIYNS